MANIVTRNQPLPQKPPQLQNHPVLQDAYTQCLLSEHDAHSAQELMYARCLGYFLLEMPGPNAQHMVADEIVLCEGDKGKMEQLAQLYINHLTRLFQQNKGSTPAPSYHPSRPSFFDDNSFFYTGTVEAAPRDHRVAKRAALERDGYKCMATGLPDWGKWDELTPAERVARGWTTTIKTNFCHIFPPSTNWNLELDTPNHSKFAGNLWNLIYAFVGIEVLEELDGDKAHRLSNGLTLELNVHNLFDSLDLWFEEDLNRPPNTYWVRSRWPIPHLPTTPITFASSSPELELPDPRYLRLHAAVCRVAHLSGVAEYLAKYEREMESTLVLAEDGSSNELLASRLQSWATLTPRWNLGEVSI